jgi:hypothetical protein
MAKTPYRKFNIRGVSHSLEHQSCRYALSPLLINKTLLGTDDEMKANFASLISQRRAVLHKLREAKYLLFLKKVDYVFAMNCPPVGVLTDQTDLRTCKRLPFCPFCWCRRYVTSTVRNYRSYLLHAAEPPDVEFFERQITCKILANDRTDMELAMSVVRNWRSPRNRPRARGRVKGASTLISIDPTESGWRLLCRQLFVVPPKPRDFEYADVPPVVTDDAKTMTTIRRTRLWYDPDEEAPGSPEQILAAAIGRFAIYPHGLMSGDIMAVRNLLEFFSEARLRLLSHCGVVRPALRRGEEEVPPATFVADDDD